VTEGLFDEGASPHRPGAPLAVRMRPATLDDLVGQAHLLEPGAPLRRLVAGGSDASSAPVSVILWGPPGTGKTTLATMAAAASGRRFVELSAVTAGVKDVREVVERAKADLGMHGRGTVLFVDEVHRFSKTQQDALLPAVENGWVTLIAATTENPSFSVISPLLSRSLLLTLRPLDDDDIREVVRRAVADPRGLGGAVVLDPAAEDHLVRIAGGDARRALTALDAAAGAVLDGASGGEVGRLTSTSSKLGTPVVGVGEVERAVQQAAVRYDRDGDQHYDVISAFIKSVRGSDVDAAMHYLARMVEAGEDPRFIARRLVILASEDIGMADPTALQTAVAAMQAVSFIGMPEGRIVLAQAVVHLSLAPKSNAAYLAIDAALDDLRRGRGGLVPPHLRDGSYAGAASHGHGQGYLYAHDQPGGVAAQEYAPEPVQGQRYYLPTSHGVEARIGEVLDRVRISLGREPAPLGSGDAAEAGSAPSGDPAGDAADAGDTGTTGSGDGPVARADGRT
jgi:putative ATPase